MRDAVTSNYELFPSQIHALPSSSCPRCTGSLRFNALVCPYEKPQRINNAPYDFRMRKFGWLGELCSSGRRHNQHSCTHAPRRWQANNGDSNSNNNAQAKYTVMKLERQMCVSFFYNAHVIITCTMAVSIVHMPGHVRTRTMETAHPLKDGSHH